MKKLDKQVNHELLVQVGACLDRCQRCHYVSPLKWEICEGCPNYEEISDIRARLFPERKKDFQNKKIQSILAKGDLINKTELEYLLVANVPVRVIADNMDVTVKELKSMIDSVGL